MEKEEALQLLENILKIYSPSGQEGPLSQFLAEKMDNFGFNVKIDKVNNVIGTIGSGSPSILLCGHMDTVPGILPVKSADGFIFGRGSVDAKSSLTAMLIAASRLCNKKDIGRIIVAGVVDEEGMGKGVKELIKSNIKTDYAIFGEPSGLDQITIGYKGRLSLIISCKTTSVHASAPWMSQNAIEKSFEVWESFRAYALKKVDKNSRFNSLTMCITKIRGGDSHNILPGNCKITLDIRIPTKMSCSSVYHDIMKIIKNYQSDVNFPKIDVEILDKVEPFETDKNSLPIRAFIVAILKKRGKRPMLLRKTGTGDMNAFGHTLKIPVVTYGPGNPHLSHTLKEYIDIVDYLTSIDIYEDAVHNLNKFHFD